MFRHALMYWAFTGLLAAPFFASAQGLPGDINLDGNTDVLDVQGAIAQAIGLIAATPEANLDEEGGVTILDIQHLINSALGVGGLVQRVHGVIDCSCDAPHLVIVAVSREGGHVIAPVDPANGEFQLLLRVRTAWAMALCAVTNAPGAKQIDPLSGLECLATFAFPIGGEMSSTLPLPELSGGGKLDLGLLVRIGDRVPVTVDLRPLLAPLDRPLPVADENGNGVPDVVEPLIRPIQGTIGLPGNFNIEGFLVHVGACLASHPHLLEHPDLRDENGNHIPDFLEPVLLCTRTCLVQFLEESPPVGGVTAQQVVEAAMARVRSGIGTWLDSLGRNLLVDENNNGVPDRFERLIATNTFPAEIDQDGNGTPDFADDQDGDGVPNIEDPDWLGRPGVSDADGDGIGDAVDLDDDNDGVPDYADPDHAAN